MKGFFVKMFNSWIFSSFDFNINNELQQIREFND